MFYVYVVLLNLQYKTISFRKNNQIWKKINFVITYILLLHIQNETREWNRVPIGFIWKWFYWRTITKITKKYNHYSSPLLNMWYLDIRKICLPWYPKHEESIITFTLPSKRIDNFPRIRLKKNATAISRPLFYPLNWMIFVQY